MARRVACLHCCMALLKKKNASERVWPCSTSYWVLTCYRCLLIGTRLRHHLCRYRSISRVFSFSCSPRVTTRWTRRNCKIQVTTSETETRDYKRCGLKIDASSARHVIFAFLAIYAIYSTLNLPQLLSLVVQKLWYGKRNKEEGWKNNRARWNRDTYLVRYNRIFHPCRVSQRTLGRWKVKARRWRHSRVFKPDFLADRETLGLYVRHPLRIRRAITLDHRGIRSLANAGKLRR